MTNILYAVAAVFCILILFGALIVWILPLFHRTQNNGVETVENPVHDMQDGSAVLETVGEEGQPSDDERTASLQETCYPVQNVLSEICQEESTKPSIDLSIQATPAEITDVDGLKDRFISIDVETTGLKPGWDRIIEIAAVKFENGIVVDSFSSLVSSVKHIPESASRVNGITDEELQLYGKDEATVFNDFLDFIGPDALSGKLFLVAHNATFDMGFIVSTLKRLEYRIKIDLHYYDTLYLSRKYLVLPNYKQSTITAQLGIVNDNAHRADADAKACGEIMVYLLDKMESDAEKIRNKYERSRPSDEEREICAYIQKILMTVGRGTERLRFEKKSNGLVLAKYPKGFVSFKVLKNKPMYFIFKKKDYVECELDSSKVDIYNTDWDFVRVNLSHPQQIDLLTDSILQAHRRDSKLITEYYSSDEWKERDALVSFTIPNAEVEGLVAACIERDELKLKQKAERNAELRKTEKEKEERRLARQQRNVEKRTNDMKMPRKQGKKIGRYDDDMNLIACYESVSSASEIIGVSPKSIRDAASGKQKHAAGFVWKFIDEE